VGAAATSGPNVTRRSEENQDHHRRHESLGGARWSYDESKTPDTLADYLDRTYGIHFSLPGWRRRVIPSLAVLKKVDAAAIAVAKPTTAPRRTERADYWQR